MSQNNRNNRQPSVRRYFEESDSNTDFAWDMIDYFNTAEELPQEQSFEKTFWYAIWNIQHLCDPEHIQDGVATKELRECLFYLNGTKELPEKFRGRRP